MESNNLQQSEFVNLRPCFLTIFLKIKNIQNFLKKQLTKPFLTPQITSDELTTAERFASENQCTLKKNERFTSALHEKKPVLEEILHIDEDPNKDKDRLSPANGASSSSSSQKSLSSSSSPIPVRNTQKFISQFADLKLTGGCQALPIHHKVEPPQQTTSNMVEDTSSSSFLSFKPKPPILTKKPNVVRTPGTPELSRKCNKE